MQGSDSEEDFGDEDSFDEETGQSKVKTADSEEEFGSDEEGDEEPEYGMEDDEEEEEDTIFSKSKKGNKADKKKKETSIFADYEEFAHLLEGDTPDSGDKKKPKFGGPKAGFTKTHSKVKRDFKRGAGPTKKGGPGKRQRR